MRCVLHEFIVTVNDDVLLFPHPVTESDRWKNGMRDRARVCESNWTGFESSFLSSPVVFVLLRVFVSLVCEFLSSIVSPVAEDILHDTSWR